MAAEQGNLPLAASELQKVTQTYSGTRSAVEAMLVLNQVRMVNGQTELAVVGLKEFIAKNPPNGVPGAGVRPPGRRAGEHQEAAGGGRGVRAGVDRGARSTT